MQRMAKKRKAKKVKTVRRDDLTPLEIHAIQIREFYTALRKAGFSCEQSLTLSTMQDAWPDWFVIPGKPVEEIGTIIDDEDED